MCFSSKKIFTKCFTRLLQYFKAHETIHFKPVNCVLSRLITKLFFIGSENGKLANLDAVTEENNSSLDTCIETHGLASPARSACVSPASSNGGVYSVSIYKQSFPELTLHQSCN